MRQVPSNNKHNVAWFKLAEFVSRGERERALGIYKLLVHAIEDRAFALQLEGDLLLAFEDERALQLYFQAASLYEKTDRMVQAAAVYEHLVALRLDDSRYRARLIDVYKKLSAQKKCNKHRESLCDILLQQNKVDQVVDHIVRTPQSDENSGHIAKLHKKVVFYWLQQKDFDEDVVISHMQKAIDAFIVASKEKFLQRFLSELQASNSQIHQYAIEYLESNSE